jgi:hypothetical protein
MHVSRLPYRQPLPDAKSPSTRICRTCLRSNHLSNFPCVHFTMRRMLLLLKYKSKYKNRGQSSSHYRVK